MMTALFVMAVTSVIVIGILDTETLQYSALRNTIEYDRARYLAEAGAAHAVAFLERDITWRDGISITEFPSGSGDTYTATVVDGPDSTVIVTASGVSGRVTRRLQLTIKQGG
jgi:type II secretory pathway component PulK